MGDVDLKCRPCGTTSTKGRLGGNLCLSCFMGEREEFSGIIPHDTREVVASVWGREALDGLREVGSSAKKSGFGCCRVECCRLPLFTAALYHAFSATTPNVKWLDILSLLQVFSGRLTLTELSAYLTRPMWQCLSGAPQFGDLTYALRVPKVTRI
jgi:hypothetical protein